ncbi:MAG: hypothetical protein R3C56_29465 [Pirellulaceae bacterium]
MHSPLGPSYRGCTLAMDGQWLYASGKDGGRCARVGKGEASNLTPALRLGGNRVTTATSPRVDLMPSLHAAMGLLALLPSALLVLSLEERTLRIAATVLPFIGACAILPIAINLLWKTVLSLLWIVIDLVNSGAVVVGRSCRKPGELLGRLQAGCMYSDYLAGRWWCRLSIDRIVIPQAN